MSGPIHPPLVIVVVGVSGCGKPTVGRVLAWRRGHYMPATLLASQLATLEEPGADENVNQVDAKISAEAAADSVLEGQLNSFIDNALCRAQY